MRLEGANLLFLTHHPEEELFRQEGNEKVKPGRIRRTWYPRNYDKRQYEEVKGQTLRLNDAEKHYVKL